MKRYVQINSCCIALLIMVACSPSLKVTSDYDKNANFQQYKSFAIDTFRQSESISQLNQNRIINAVRAEMIKKGFTENTSNPDVFVHISAIIKNKQSISSNTSYYGYGGGYRPYAWGGGMGASGYTTYNVDDYKDGSLIIDVADAKTKSLVWEGIGNREIDGPIKDPDTAVPAAISSIMKSFPPGSVAK